MKSLRVFCRFLPLVLLAFPLVAQQPSRDPRYPAHWWTPVVDPKKPDWEILPQEAGPGEVILAGKFPRARPKRANCGS